ncbi:hypothetical protein [Hymenobacter sediminicola]|uniref:Uncharacterized protein n=1 Tax=Hymenobacter sediminicola TaxID=2761579 RepID=A0A7G7W3Q7_9BACT|nr:hypothetical protein [Hymenobacter sediminicola]QNH61000.1 hypothetical protein H4317_12500 [Hymenobacter sediminicola]
MRVTILEKIKAETPLAQLFNAYMRGLSTLEIFSTPRESMHACRVGFAREAKAPAKLKSTSKYKSTSLAYAAQRYYELTVLSNSLGHLYWCIEEADKVLQDFFTTHNGDLLAYAKDNRRRSLSEYGGGDDDDWQPDPAAPDGWAVADTNEPARLADYTLHSELGRFFANEAEHGEYIGTSGPIDYGYFTTLVENQTDFCARKMLAAGGLGQLPMYAPNEAGEMVEIPVIDLIEREINEDINNERLTAYFCGVLNAGQHLATCYATMPRHELTGYRLLREVLGSMLAVKVAAYPPF